MAGIDHDFHAPIARPVVGMVRAVSLSHRERHLKATDSTRMGAHLEAERPARSGLASQTPGCSGRVPASWSDRPGTAVTGVPKPSRV